MEVTNLKISHIEANPENARGKESFTKNDLADLIVSINKFGIAVPLIVMEKPDDLERYILIAGHRRLAAAIFAGLTEVPAIIRDDGWSTPEMIAMLENQYRKPLSLLEELKAVERVLEAGDDVNVMRDRLGINATQWRLRKNITENLDRAWKDDLSNLPQMTVGGLELIARMPAPVQQAFHVEFKESLEFGNTTMTGKALTEFIKDKLENYSVNLKTKYWPEDWTPGDSLLVCMDCPQRSDKIGQGDLFPAAKPKKAKIVLCLNADCFKAKKIAWTVAQYMHEAKAMSGLQVITTDQYWGKETDRTVNALVSNGAVIIRKPSDYKFCKVEEKGAIPVFVVGGEFNCAVKAVKSLNEKTDKKVGRPKLESTEEKVENLHGLRLKIVFADLKKHMEAIEDPTKYFGRSDLAAFLVAFGPYGCGQTFGKPTDHKLLTALATGCALEFKHPWDTKVKTIKADIDLAMWLQVIGSILRAIPDKGTAQDALDAEMFAVWFGEAVKFDIAKAMEKAIIEKPDPKSWAKKK